jgi:hypothetical protein
MHHNRYLLSPFLASGFRTIKKESDSVSHGEDVTLLTRARPIAARVSSLAAVPSSLQCAANP